MSEPGRERVAERVQLPSTAPDAPLPVSQGGQDGSEACGAVNPRAQHHFCDRPKGHTDNHTCRETHAAHAWACWRQEAPAPLPVGGDPQNGNALLSEAYGVLLDAAAELEPALWAKYHDVGEIVQSVRHKLRREAHRPHRTYGGDS